MGQNRFILLDARHSGNEALSTATPGLRIAMASNEETQVWIVVCQVRLAGHSIIGSRK